MGKAMAPLDIALTADAGSCPASDEDFINELFVPGVQLVAEPWQVSRPAPCAAEAAHGAALLPLFIRRRAV